MTIPGADVGGKRTRGVGERGGTVAEAGGSAQQVEETLHVEENLPPGHRLPSRGRRENCAEQIWIPPPSLSCSAEPSL